MINLTIMAHRERGRLASILALTSRRHTTRDGRYCISGGTFEKELPLLRSCAFARRFGTPGSGAEIPFEPRRRLQRIQHPTPSGLRSLAPRAPRHREDYVARSWPQPDNSGRPALSRSQFANVTTPRARVFSI